MSIMIAYLTAVSEDDYDDLLSYRCPWWQVLWSSTTAVSEDEYDDRLPYRCPWGRVLWSLTLLLSLKDEYYDRSPLAAAPEDEKDVDHDRQDDQAGDPGELTPRNLTLKSSIVFIQPARLQYLSTDK
jgi:hypothetical protein